MAQAQTASEKKKIELKMTSDPELSFILKLLQATDQDDIVTEERARRHQARQSRVAADIEAMDVDDEDVWLFFFFFLQMISLLLEFSMLLLAICCSAFSALKNKSNYSKECQSSISCALLFY